MTNYSYVTWSDIPFPDTQYHLERDGLHFRWVMRRNGRRIAKGSRWWASRGRALLDLTEFLDGLAILTRAA